MSLTDLALVRLSMYFCFAFPSPCQTDPMIFRHEVSDYLPLFPFKCHLSRYTRKGIMVAFSPPLPPSPIAPAITISDRGNEEKGGGRRHHPKKRESKAEDPPVYPVGPFYGRIFMAASTSSTLTPYWVHLKECRPGGTQKANVSLFCSTAKMPVLGGT